MFAGFFLGITLEGLGKKEPITRIRFDAFRYPYFDLV
jgi:hypothetical protein